MTNRPIKSAYGCSIDVAVLVDVLPVNPHPHML